MWVRTEVSFSNDPAAAGGGTDRETGSTSKKQLLPGSELLPDPLDFVRSCSQLSRIDFLVGISVNLTEVGVHLEFMMVVTSLGQKYFKGVSCQR